MIPGIVTLQFIHPAAISQEEATACLTIEEQSHASKFRFEKDAIHWRACRAGLRKILAKTIASTPLAVPIILGDHGKPLLAKPFDHLHFNLTHCADLALVATCIDGPVGVDLEPLTRAADLLDCVDTFCHPEEIRKLPGKTVARMTRLLQIWTAKEAILKAIGMGLSYPPDKILTIFENHGEILISAPGLDGIEKQCLRELTHPTLQGYQAVLSAPLSASYCKFLGDF